MAKKSYIINKGKEQYFPETYLEAVKDKQNGITLKDILAGFNMLFLSYNSSKSNTRLQVASSYRRTGLWITYVLLDKTVITEWYAGEAIDDNSWGNDSNWRNGSNALVGDVSISSDGYWVINGVTTNTKAQGERGITALLRVGDSNKLEVSYTQGSTWNVISDYIASWFRWLSTSTGVGKIQISRDNQVTWQDLSPTFSNNLYIKGYVATVGALPSSAALGDIYGVGPTYATEDPTHTNPIYNLYVKTSSGWVDNGKFTSISAGVVQTLGQSETEVMSQKTVSDNINYIKSNFSFRKIGKNEYDSSNNTIGKLIYNNGDIISNELYSITEPIKVNSNLILNKPTPHGVGHNILDENGNRLRTIATSNYIYQSGDYAIIFCIKNSWNYVQIEKGDKSTKYEPYTSSIDAVNLAEVIFEDKVPVVIGKNKLDTRTSDVGKFIYADGSEGTNPSYAISDFIPVHKNMYISPILSAGTGCNVYNISYDKIRTFSTNNYIFQEGDAYIKVSYRITSKNQVEEGDSATTYEPYTDKEDVVSLIPNIVYNSFKIPINKLDYTINVYGGSIKRKYGIDKPINQTGQTTSGTNSHMYAAFLGKVKGNFKVALELITNIDSSKFTTFGYNITQMGNGLIKFECNFTNTDPSVLRVNIFPRFIFEKEEYIRVNEFSVTPLDIESFNSLQSNLDYLENKNIIVVSKSFDSTTSDFGVSKFNSIITAHDYVKTITTNLYNQFLIRVMPGLYDEFETVWAGSAEEGPTSGLEIGILVRNYEFFESFDIDTPEITQLKWDGFAGFPVGYIMSTSQCMRRCIFHILYRPMNTSISGFYINTKNTRYCVHLETASTGAGNSWIIQNLLLQYDGRPNCEAQNENHIGIGISCNESGLISNCKAIGSGNSFVSGHNNGWNIANQGPKPLVCEGAKLIIQNCNCGNKNISMSTYQYDAETPDSLTIKECGNINRGYFYYTSPATPEQGQNWKANVINSSIVDNSFNT